ncbi:hypothetical protein ACOME3_010269 [Neoechinorhynchus agilis]
MFVQYDGSSRNGCYSAYLKECCYEHRPRAMIDPSRTLSIREEGTNIRLKSGKTLNSQHGAVCRSEIPIPASCCMFYYEVKLIQIRSSAGSEESIGTGGASCQREAIDVIIGYGLSDPSSSQVVATSMDSVGIRSNCQRVIKNSNYTDSSDEVDDQNRHPLPAGAVIGAILNRLDNEITFTINGAIHGDSVAIDEEVSMSDTYVLISVMNRGSGVIVNFSDRSNGDIHTNFMFDMDEPFANTINSYWSAETATYATNPTVDETTLHHLCLSHVAHAGYLHATEKLALSDSSSRSLLKRRLEFSEDPGWRKHRAKDLEFRSQVRKAVMDGKVGRAIISIYGQKCEFWTKYPFLFFYMLNQSFMESVLGFDDAYDQSTTTGGMLYRLIGELTQMSRVRETDPQAVSGSTGASRRSTGGDADKTATGQRGRRSSRLTRASNGSAQESVRAKDLNILRYAKAINRLWHLFYDGNPKGVFFSPQYMKELFGSQALIPPNIIITAVSCIVAGTVNAVLSRMTIERRNEVASALNAIILEDSRVAFASQLEILAAHGRQLVEMLDRAQGAFRGTIIPSRCILYSEPLLKVHGSHKCLVGNLALATTDEDDIRTVDIESIPTDNDVEMVDVE